MATPLLIAKNKNDFYLLPKMANRHGLIAGATGTGKTVTLQKMAESLSSIGVPVFMADVKGDLTGVSQQGIENLKVQDRVNKLDLANFNYQSFPVALWDVLQTQGHPIRATVSDMGPILFGRILNLNEVQTGVLTIIFKIADEQGLLLLDLKDLQSMCQFVGEHAAEFTTKYGNISKASIGAIQRGIIEITTQQGEKFFGEPMLDVFDLLQTDTQGKGMINILAADQLIRRPKTYAVFLLWLLSELFEQLPEVGDLEKPKLVFFFDEAHLLFEDISEALLDQIEQVVRLIRSKGVGVYFISQNPKDIPDKVLAQLGNRIQHALRAFTPQDQKAIKAMAQTFRTNPSINVEQVITQLEVGEALISFLDENGTPGMVDRAYIIPPQGRIGPINPQERQTLIANSIHYGNYEKTLDRESAYERISQQAAQQASQQASSPSGQATRAKAQPVNTTQDLLGAMAKSAIRAVGSQVGRQIARGVLGSILGGRGRRSLF